MYNGFKEYLFLVVDNYSNGVLTKCVSASCANAVTRGMLNTTTMVIKFPFMKTNHNINRYQDDVRLNYKLVKPFSINNSKIKPPDPDGEANNFSYYETENADKPFDLIDLEKKFINADWIQRRKLANFRSQHLRNLEAICERHMARLKSFVSDEAFFIYLSTQLPLVNGSNYPSSIREWADIYGISYESAHDELQMIFESTGISVMRVNAIWTKYVDLINSLSSEEEILDLYQKIETELMHGER